MKKITGFYYSDLIVLSFMMRVAFRMLALTKNVRHNAVLYLFYKVLSY